MRLLVTGARGQLGSDVLKYSVSCGMESIGATHEDFDITDAQASKDYISYYHPDAVIHCAAYNSVDQAEDEPKLCRLVNYNGTVNIATACSECHAKMLYVSTDYVFSGKNSGIYEAEDEVDPLSVYGKSKAEGEAAVLGMLSRCFIVRTSWLFGRNGKNFVKTMTELAKRNRSIRVVEDQVGSPTYTVDLAPLLVQMVCSNQYGIYHATNEGFCSWADFAEEIMRLLGAECTIQRIKSAEYPTKATRPLNSRLSKEKLLRAGFYKLPLWQDELQRYFFAKI